jgi:hypothetical protein
MKTLLESLPARFRDDHAERGLPDTVESIKADAEYYVDLDGPDECPLAIKSSASATLRKIVKAEVVASKLLTTS